MPTPSEKQSDIGGANSGATLKSKVSAPNKSTLRVKLAVTRASFVFPKGGIITLARTNEMNQKVQIATVTLNGEGNTKNFSATQDVPRGTQTGEVNFEVTWQSLMPTPGEQPTLHKISFPSQE